MKKLFLFLFILFFSFSSCYIDTDYPCYERVDYSYYNLNKNYSPAVIKVYFNEFCPQNYGYNLLVNDNVYGTEYINGRWWRFVSNVQYNSPLVSYVDGFSFLPYRTYRCIIISTSGTISDEFNISTY